MATIIRDGAFSTFDRVGKDFIKGSPTVYGIPEEMAFSVRKEPMGFINSNGNFQRIVGNSTIVRDYDDFAYGAVSDKYTPVDNVTALGCLQYMEGMEVKKYGSTKSGMQFIIGALPEVSVLGDSFIPYLIFRNSFDGRYPIQCAISPLRIVCQNQLTMAFKNANNTFNIKHTVKAVERLEEAQEILLGANEFMKELNSVAEKYASMKVSKEQEMAIIRELFPIADNMSARQKETQMERIAHFETALHRDDVANFNGTAWKMVQAFSDYETHPLEKRHTETANENNFMAVSFDARPMMQLLSIMDKMVA